MIISILINKMAKFFNYENWHVDLEESFIKNETIAEEVSFNPNYFETELAKDLKMCCEKLNPNFENFGFSENINSSEIHINNFKQDYMLSQVANDLEKNSENLNEKFFASDEINQDYMKMDDNSLPFRTNIEMMQQVKCFFFQIFCLYTIFFRTSQKLEICKIFLQCRKRHALKFHCKFINIQQQIYYLRALVVLVVQKKI